MSGSDWAEGSAHADAREGPEDCEANARLVNSPLTPV